MNLAVCNANMSHHTTHDHITFMKYNWLKPISFISIFEFEVDPYMEWLYRWFKLKLSDHFENKLPRYGGRQSYWFVHKSMEDIKNNWVKT